MTSETPKHPLQFGIRHLVVLLTIMSVVAAATTIVRWQGTYRLENQVVFLLTGLVWASNVVLLGKVVRCGALVGALVANVLVADVLVFVVRDGAPYQAVWLSFYVSFVGGCLSAAAAALWARAYRVAAVTGCVGIAACAYNAMAWDEIRYLLLPP